MSLRQDSLTFVRRLLHVVFELRDFDAGLAMLSPEVSWIGVGKHEVCRDFQDAIRMLSSEHKLANTVYVMRDLWLQYTPVDEQSCCVLGEFTLEELRGETIVGCFELRCSIVCRQYPEGIKAMHSHYSLAGSPPRRGDASPCALVESYNQLLEQQLEQRTRKLRENTDAMESLLSSMTGGVVVCRLTGELPIVYHNEGFCELCGYNHDELESLLGNRYAQLVAPEYSEYSLNALQRQLTRGTRYQLEYPIIHRDGSKVWVLDKGSVFLNANGESLIQAVMTDITSQKKLEEELRQQNEVLTLNKQRMFDVNVPRNAIIDYVLTQSSVVYEINLTTDEVLSGVEQWEREYSIVPTGKYSEDMETFARQAIHPEDAGDFMVIFRLGAVRTAFAEGRTDLCCEYRKLHPTDGYRWHTFTLHLYVAEDGSDLCAIGYVQDIHERKQQQLKLIYDAEHDPLTGLLNKARFEQAVNTYLSGEGKDGNHAFLIFDLDNFKRINDSLGHAFGDVVISRIASKAVELFREHDLLGRVGGDEFAIFMKNIGNPHVAENKANELCDGLHGICRRNDIPFPVSISVGVAYYPLHGCDYQELYANSDIALYTAKEGGRNRSMVYNSALTITPPITPATDSDDFIVPRQLDRNTSEYIFRILYDTPDKYAAIHSALELMGKQYGVSRSYIFEENLEGTGISNTFEWCAEGVASQIDQLQNLDYSIIDEYPLNFNEAGIYYLPDITVTPVNTRALLSAQGVVSMIQFEIRRNDAFYGFVGFDFCDCTITPTKSDISVLRTVANMLGVFLTEMRSVEMSENMSRVALSIVDALDSYAYIIDPTTYRLLLINEKTRSLSPTTIMGDYCYRAFMGQDAPCSDCAMKALGKEHDARLSVNVMNERLNKHTRATASWLDWTDGSRVCLMHRIEL